MAGVGLVGAGEIAPAYLERLTAFKGIQVVGLAGGRSDRGRMVAERFDVPLRPFEALLRHNAIELIVNLTPPAFHADITIAALRAGKSVYTEKPMAVSIAEREAIGLAALQGGTTLAVAPATHLGPAQQTARQIIDSGQLGDIVAASATLVYPGPDLFHINADRLFQPDTGPLYDMGIYDITALTQLLGPVEAVSAMSTKLRRERKIIKGPRAGERFAVNTHTHVAALLRFVSGVIATLTVSFEGYTSGNSGLEIIGTKAALRLPRASSFVGQVTLSTGLDAWQEVPDFSADWSDALWIIGVLDCADAMQAHRAPRCSAQSAAHAADVLAAIETAAATSAEQTISSRLVAAPPLAAGDYRRLCNLFGLEAGGI